MKKLLNEVGKCPFCGSDDLDYDCMEPTEDMIYYPWTCKNCGHKGEEWYDISFAGHNIETEDGCMIDVDSVNNSK
jgi:predicted nucleic-acid-binding Zn-ribbon protein